MEPRVRPSDVATSLPRQTTIRPVRSGEVRLYPLIKYQDRLHHQPAVDDGRVAIDDVRTNTEQFGMPETRTVHLARHHLLPQDGSDTVFCIMTYRGEPGRALAYLSPGQFPEFEGETAWFRVRWFSKKRREFLEQVDPSK